MRLTRERAPLLAQLRDGAGGVGLPHHLGGRLDERAEPDLALAEGLAGEAAVGDVLVGHDDAGAGLPREARHAYLEPALLVGAVARVLHREIVGVSRQCLADSGPHGSALRPACVAHGEVVGPDAGGPGGSAVGVAEAPPRLVRRDDHPPLVENGDVGREGVHRAAEELLRRAQRLPRAVTSGDVANNGLHLVGADGDDPGLQIAPPPVLSQSLVRHLLQVPRFERRGDGLEPLGCRRHSVHFRPDLHDRAAEERLGVGGEEGGVGRVHV